MKFEPKDVGKLDKNESIVYPPSRLLCWRHTASITYDLVLVCDQHGDGGKHFGITFTNMKMLQMLYCLSNPRLSKIPCLLETRCVLTPMCQLATVAEKTPESFPVKKLRTPRKNLTPILKQELDLKQGEIQQLFRAGALETLDKYSLKHRLQNLREMGFENEDIRAELSVLLVPEKEIMVRKAILEECGLTEITTTLLSHFEVVLKRRISLLKAGGLIASDVNVPENILSYAPASVPPPKFYFLRKARYLSARATAEALPLGVLHKYVVLHYMEWFFDDFTLSKKKRLFKINSLRRVIQGYDALRKLNVSKNQLRQCLYLSQCDPENLDDLLNSYPKVGGESIKKMIRKIPRIALCTPSHVQAVLECVRMYGFSERKVAAYPAILTVDVNDLHQGLSLLKSVPDLWALRYSDGILRLLCEKQLIQKLRYFKSLPQKVVPTISLLTSCNAAIIRALQRNSARAPVQDFLNLLSMELRTDVSNVKRILSRHRYWRLGSAAEILSTLSLLRSQGFKDRDILENVQILLYPRSYVEGIIQEKVNPIMVGEGNAKVPTSKDLSLCLYYIEREHGFTGLGIINGPQTIERAFENYIRCKGRPCQQDCLSNPLCGLSGIETSRSENNEQAEERR